MSTRFDFEGFGVIGTITGIAGLLYSIYKENKLNDACNKINLAVDDVSRRSHIDISNSIVYISLKMTLNYSNYIIMLKKEQKI